MKILNKLGCFFFKTNIINTKIGFFKININNLASSLKCVIKVFFVSFLFVRLSNIKLKKSRLAKKSNPFSNRLFRKQNTIIFLIY